MNLFQKLVFLLSQKENNTKSELSEEDALSIIQNSECVFLKQASQYIQNAYVSDPKIRKRNILLAHSRVESSIAFYQYCGNTFPYNKAIDVLFKGFRERELKRKDLEDAYQ